MCRISFLNYIVKTTISHFGIFVNGIYNSFVGRKYRTNSEIKILAKLLREIRMNANLRQVDLAERLNLPQSFISKYESGERRLDLIELRRICSALEIPLEEIVRHFEDRINEAQ